MKHRYPDISNTYIGMLHKENNMAPHLFISATKTCKRSSGYTTTTKLPIFFSLQNGSLDEK